MIERLDRYQRSHSWLGMPLAVVYKFVDDQGGFLAALLAYYAFLSLFPLLLLLVTLLGFALAGDPQLQRSVMDSALHLFPVIGQQIGANVSSLHGSRVALVIGVLTCLYGGLGIAQAGQATMNKVWAVPRNARPDPLRSRLRGLGLLAVFGAGVITTTAVTAATLTAGSLAPGMGYGLRIGSAALSVAINSMLLLLVFRVLMARRVPARDLLPGALVAAVVWEGLQLCGTYLVTHQLRGANATYGIFGVVLGLVAWLWLGSLTVVLAAEVNVVTARRLWPRSLLTPFTDAVDLTAADEAAYSSYAKTERHKGFETVEVDFDGDHRG